MKESKSDYTCRYGRVMVGRYHKGDENGKTKYYCAGLYVENGGSVDVLTASWSEEIKESKGTYFTCPSGSVMVGRYHKGDENGKTKYKCAVVRYEGRSPVFTGSQWSTEIKESKWGSYYCPTGSVMIGRRHKGDENGKTTYKCAFLKFPYRTKNLISTYRGESTNCVWQDRRSCPPYVTYLSFQDRQTKAIFVKNGKLYDSNSKYFDTGSASPSHTGRKAIFVMDENGQLYASNYHEVYRFHHSSFLAGGLVRAAGELSVRNGVIEEMSNCSGHYRPTYLITEQARESLKLQGYSKSFTYKDCSRTRLRMTLRYETAPNAEGTVAGNRATLADASMKRF